MRGKKGFTIAELIVALIILLGLSVVVIKIGSSFYELVARQRDISKGERIAEAIKRFYETYPEYVNSLSGGITLPNGCVLQTFTDFLPKYRAGLCGGGGLRAFEPDPYDSAMSNYRVIVTGLIDAGNFQYRNIYIILTRSRRNGVRSTVDGRGEIRCARDEVCFKVDGREITQKVYERAMRDIKNVVDSLQAYALARYGADATKNVLLYRFANASSNGQNDRNCGTLNKNCFFDSGVVIAPSCGREETPRIRWLNGYQTVNLPMQLQNVSFARASVIAPSLFSQYEDVYIANCGQGVRTPETVSETELGGWTAIVLKCISLYNCYWAIARH